MRQNARDSALPRKAGRIPWLRVGDQDGHAEGGQLQIGAVQNGLIAVGACCLCLFTNVSNVLIVLLGAAAGLALRGGEAKP